ncbi:hypothetical protein GTQ48_10750 [Alteromonas genovensis]|uniref:Uncharacterized protein n=1 Tax=Alteromonas genovensis TaxID=471225 RepID=A0A6N9TJB1_9ALTE|nr:hypothetical protein [Alteromonas genovensis]
MLPVLIGMFCQ